MSDKYLSELKKKLHDPLTFYFLISFLGILTFFVYAFVYGGTIFDWLAMENNGQFNFIDFFMHIFFVKDRHILYRNNTNSAAMAIFPPLVYMMYYFFYKILYRVDSIPDDMYEAMDMPYAMLVFVYYTIFVVLFLFIAISQTGAKDRKTDIKLWISLILSAPFFAGSIEKGNSVAIAVVLLIFALVLRNSDVRWHKEAALILIAVSAALKIYPAVFGLIYLLEKRWKEAARLIVYGIVFFFVPFVFFGRTAGFRVWLENISAASYMFEYGRIQFIKGAVYTTLMDLTGREYMGIAKVSPYIFLLLMLTLCCISVNKYRRIFFLCAIMSLFANYSYRYALCYLAIPLVFIIKESETTGSQSQSGCSKTDCSPRFIEMILYGLLFTIPTWLGIITDFELSYGSYTYIMTYVDIYVYAVAYLLVLYMVIIEISDQIKRFKDRHKIVSME